MRIDEALNEILKELERAEVKHPIWPDGIVNQVAIMAGEAGEALRAANRIREGRGTVEELLPEIIQTGAMCLRLMKYLSFSFPKSYLRQTLDNIEEIATYHGGER